MPARIFNRLEEGMLAFLLAAMVLLQFVQVILRYVFATGFVWALEATVYMFAWLVLIGMSYGVKAGSHIAVDALVNALPDRGRRVAGILAALLGCVYAALMMYGGWNYFSTIYRVGVYAHELPIKRWILVSIVPIGFALLLYRLLEVAWRIIRGEASGFKVADEAADALELQNSDADITAPRGLQGQETKS